MEFHNSCVFAKDSKKSQETFFQLKMPFYLKKKKLFMLYTDI